MKRKRIDIIPRARYIPRRAPSGSNVAAPQPPAALERSPGTLQRENLVAFCNGNPYSALTIQSLRWTCSKAYRLDKPVLVIFWDHASWHIRKEVLGWVHKHNRQVKQSGKGVRLLVCLLPKQSLWSNAIEPMWIHANRKLVEPERKLSATEVVSRVCSVFAHPHKILKCYLILH